MAGCPVYRALWHDIRTRKSPFISTNVLFPRPDGEYHGDCTAYCYNLVDAIVLKAHCKTAIIGKNTDCAPLASSSGMVTFLVNPPCGVTCKGMTVVYSFTHCGGFAQRYHVRPKCGYFHITLASPSDTIVTPTLSMLSAVSNVDNIALGLNPSRFSLDEMCLFIHYLQRRLDCPTIKVTRELAVELRRRQKKHAN